MEFGYIYALRTSSLLSAANITMCQDPNFTTTDPIDVVEMALKMAQYSFILCATASSLEAAPAVVVFGCGFVAGAVVSFLQTS